MSEFYDAFEMSPVPEPGPDAVAPEPFRGIYAMPAFATVASADLVASTQYWTEGLGFVELFSTPGQMVHLRRWAFQDVLLVAGEPPVEPAPHTLSFACVLSQMDEIFEASRMLWPDGAQGGPVDTPWNTRDLALITPENIRVTMTAAKVFDPSSAEAQHLADIGITHPDHRDQQP